MNRREAHRFDRLHHVREVEAARCRQDLVTAHAALRTAAQVRDEARAAVGQLPVNGVREYAEFTREIRLGEIRTEKLAATQDRLLVAEASFGTAHAVWVAAARRVQGLDKLVERRREAARAEELQAEAHEHQDLFLARRGLGQR